jgi:hypothetical protein
MPNHSAFIGVRAAPVSLSITHRYSIVDLSNAMGSSGRRPSEGLEICL